MLLAMWILLIMVTEVIETHGHAESILFADDHALAVEWQNLPNPPEFLGDLKLAYDLADEAIGTFSNARKRQWIPTRPINNHERDEILQAFDLGGWDPPQIVPKAKHLGVLYGASITPEEFFAGATHKIKANMAMWDSKHGKDTATFLWRLFAVSVLAFPGSCIPPDSKTIGSAWKHGTRMGGIPNDWGWSNLTHADMLSAQNNHWVDPDAWCWAARLGMHQKYHEDFEPIPGPLRRSRKFGPLCIQLQWEKAATRFHKVTTLRPADVVKRYDTLKAATQRRKQARADGLGVVSGFPDLPDWTGHDPRHFLLGGADGSGTDNQAPWGKDKTATFGVAINHGTHRLLRASGYIRNYFALPANRRREGWFNGSSGAGEAGGVVCLLRQVALLPHTLPRRLHAQVDWAPALGAALGSHRLHKEPVQDWQLYAKGVSLQRQGWEIALERVPGHQGYEINEEADKAANGHHGSPHDLTIHSQINRRPLPPAAAPAEHRNENEDEDPEIEELDDDSPPLLRRPGLQTLFYQAIRAHRFLDSDSKAPFEAWTRRMAKWDTTATGTEIQLLCGHARATRVPPRLAWSLQSFLLNLLPTDGHHAIKQQRPQPPCAFCAKPQADHARHLAGTDQPMCPTLEDWATTALEDDNDPQPTLTLQLHKPTGDIRRKTRIIHLLHRIYHDRHFLNWRLTRQSFHLAYTHTNFQI
jgi:hypothetical protein